MDNASLLDRLRKILKPSQMLRVARDVAGEKVAPKRTAERLGVGEDYRRTEEMLSQPAVDSVMALSGGAKPGVFFPKTSYAKEIGTLPPNVRTPTRQVFELAQQGMYNPLTGRVAFPAETTDPRGAALAVGSVKYAQEREGGAEGIRAAREREYETRWNAARAQGRQLTDPSTMGAREAFRATSQPPMQVFLEYQKAFRTAYNFLTDTSQDPKVTMKQLEALDVVTPDATRIARRLLADPLFAKHPLRRR